MLTLTLNYCCCALANQPPQAILFLRVCPTGHPPLPGCVSVGQVAEAGWRHVIGISLGREVQIIMFQGFAMLINSFPPYSPGRGSWLLQPLAQLTSRLLAHASLSLTDSSTAPMEPNYRQRLLSDDCSLMV